MSLNQTLQIVIRNKKYSILNIVGLAIGVASAIMILLWVENEAMFNRTFSNAENIYRLGRLQHNDNETYLTYSLSLPLIDVVANNYPEVKRITRYSAETRLQLGKEDDIEGIMEPGIYADSTIISMLQTRIISGNKEHLLTDLTSIIISKKLSEKLFGKSDPLGKILESADGQVMQITGVFDKSPENSSFVFEWIRPYEAVVSKMKNMDPNSYNSHRSSWTACYVELHKGVEIEIFNNSIYNVCTEQGWEGGTNVILFPIVKERLYGEFKNSHFTGSGEIRKVRLYTSIALIIILIACINFMNLSTARAEKRALEVGVRKTFGAKRKDLIKQFYLESSLITGIAMIVAIIIVVIMINPFNNLLNSNLSIDLLKINHIIGFILLFIVCTILAGSYPALYLSSFNPITTLKRTYSGKRGKEVWARKFLVIFQFATSFILICATITIYLQIDHVKNRPLGFSTKDVVGLNFSYLTQQKFESIQDKLIQSGYVKNAALSSDVILSINLSIWGVSWNGKDPGFNPVISMMWGSPGIIETIQFSLLEGRDFRDKNDNNSVIINRKMAELMGEEGKIGGYIDEDEIIGIIDNIVFNDIYLTEYSPLMLKNKYDLTRHMMIKLADNIDITAALGKIEDILSDLCPGYKFDFYMMDDLLSNRFIKDRQTGKLVTLFSILSIIISCLGLYGLNSFYTEQRRKEIGIRKVLGATVGNITYLLTKSLITLAIISFIVGTPIAIYVCNKWMEGFDYKITLSWTLFLLVATAMTIITLVTVISQSVKAAISNPVNAIKAL